MNEQGARDAAGVRRIAREMEEQEREEQEEAV